ncbi:hypothetical protein Droror1_Dr00015835 [Drosera rotundifolia]
MATTWSFKCGFHVSLALLCLLSISFLQSDSVSVSVDGYDKNSIDTKTMNSKLVLGSRPPRCMNRCFNCRPCMAVLVVPPRGRPSRHRSNNVKTPQDDEGYYLLSWKCRCKNKFFQP